MRHTNTKERRESVLRAQTQDHIVRLIEDYYPPLLRVRILRCIQRQRYGHTTNLCRHEYCPACSPRESHNRALRQLRTFEAFTPIGEKVRVAHHVYTLPPHLHELVRSKDGYASWKRAVFMTIRELYQAEPAGIANLHPMGDRDITKLHLHFDVLVNGHHLTPDGNVEKLATPAMSFDDARAVYVRHLARELNIEESRIPVIDTWWGRRKGSRDLASWYTSKARVWNKFQYSSRNVYQPHRAWRVPEHHAHQGKTWAYKPKKNEYAAYFQPDDVMRHLLAQKAWMRTIKPRVWFGMMADNQRKRTQPLFRPTPKSLGRTSGTLDHEPSNPVPASSAEGDQA